MNASVSICIPVYNGAAFLRECLDSVVAQTYEACEIVIVDDCSTDEGPAIVAEYAQRFASIKSFRNAQNLGLVGNWNRCVEVATHDWIKFVFQDDLIAPTCVARMMEYARDPAVLVTCKRDFIFDDDAPESQIAAYARNQRRVDYFFDQSDFAGPLECRRIALDRFGYNVFGEPTSVLLHRSFFARFGFFREGLMNLCDLEYWIRVAIHTGAHYVAEPLARFRVHGGATTAVNHRMHDFRLATLDHLLLVHDFAELPVYEPLRRHGMERMLPLDLRAIHASMLHKVFAMADWRRRDRAAPDHGPMKELEAFYVEFPSLRRNALAHKVWRLRASVRAWRWNRRAQAF